MGATAASVDSLIDSGACEHCKASSKSEAKILTAYPRAAASLFNQIRRVCSLFKQIVKQRKLTHNEVSKVSADAAIMMSVFFSSNLPFALENRTARFQSNRRLLNLS